MKPLLTRQRWGIYSDGGAIWLCDDTLDGSAHYCSGRFCHVGLAIHRGPLRRVRPFYAPWQTAHWCVRWAVRQLDVWNAIPVALDAVKTEIADAAEVERILETL